MPHFSIFSPVFTIQETPSKINSIKEIYLIYMLCIMHRNNIHSHKSNISHSYQVDALGDTITKFIINLLIRLLICQGPSNENHNAHIPLTVLDDGLRLH